MKCYALDSNIVSYYLGKNNKIMDKVDTILRNNDSIIIPPFENIAGLATENWAKD